MPKNEKTLIGVLASHDCPSRNEDLANVFRKAYSNSTTRKKLRNFRFVFIGGTYERLFEGTPASGQQQNDVKHRLDGDKRKKPIKYTIRDFLHDECGVIKLRSKDDGGVIMLASLITQRKVSLIWPFFSPHTAHLLFPDNLALLRLADQWHAKKLLNTGSVEEWINCEALRDRNLNTQPAISKFDFPSGTIIRIENAQKSQREETVKAILSQGSLEKGFKCYKRKLSDKTLGLATIALISHDEMKDRMINFVVDYEHELEKFRNILATGTTGKLIKEACPDLRDRVKLYHSGPKGGDIEIATEILVGACHLVIFFVDPLHSHPHIEDIRVIFSACMIHDDVPILSNEMQARAWMDHRIRGV